MPNQPKKVWFICQRCKRPFETDKRALRRGRKYCSRSCANYGREQAGENNPNWKGGVTKHIKGYIYRYAPEHPRAHNGYVLEHILVAEDKLGRRLKPGETVHHNDGKKDNNKPYNVKVFRNTGEHTRFHNKQRSKRPFKGVKTW